MDNNALIGLLNNIKSQGAGINLPSTQSLPGNSFKHDQVSRKKKRAKPKPEKPPKQAKSEVANSGKRRGSKITAFVEIRNPKMTNYFELLQEKAKPEEIKLLSEQVKRRRNENKRMTGHVFEMEKALRNFEIRQERARRQRVQTQKKSMNVLKELVDKKGPGFNKFLSNLTKQV